MALMIGVFAHGRKLRLSIARVLAKKSVPKLRSRPLFVAGSGSASFQGHLRVHAGFFPSVVSMVCGIKSVDPDMLDLARSDESIAAGDVRSHQHAQALPSIFAGLKVSGHIGVVGAVVGEFSVRTRASLSVANRQRETRLAADVRRADRSVCDRRPSLCSRSTWSSDDDPVARIAT